jgi:tripartite-type tricarboxylate transporter receptor subunit TctC
MMVVSKARRSLMLAAGIAWGAPQVAAQSYPARPIRIIVPTTPGGGYDNLGRMVAERLSPELGNVGVVVENRTGGGTLVGTQAAAAAAPDGYTLVVGGLANMALNAGLYRNPQYDPATDFIPIALVASFSYCLVARKDLPQNSLAELIAFGKANPGKLIMATGGTGSGQHVAAVMLRKLAGIDMVEVPYKGAQAAYTDLVGGRVDLFFDNTTTAQPLIEAGRVKPIATSGSRRDASLPNVPTAVEAGLAGMELESWLGIFAPARTPAPVVDRLRSAMAVVARQPELRKRLEGGGWRMLDMSTADTERYVKAEAERWPRFLREAGISGE